MSDSGIFNGKLNSINNKRHDIIDKSNRIGFQQIFNSRFHGYLTGMNVWRPCFSIQVGYIMFIILFVLFSDWRKRTEYFNYFSGNFNEPLLNIIGMLRTVRSFEYLFFFFNYLWFLWKGKGTIFSRAQCYNKRQIVCISAYLYKWRCKLSLTIKLLFSNVRANKNPFVCRYYNFFF